MFDDSSLEILPSLLSLVALEGVRGWVALVTDLEVLFKVLDETAPVDDFVRLDELQQLASLKIQREPNSINQIHEFLSKSSLLTSIWATAASSCPRSKCESDFAARCHKARGANR